MATPEVWLSLPSRLPSLAPTLRSKSTAPCAPSPSTYCPFPRRRAVAVPARRRDVRRVLDCRPHAAEQQGRVQEEDEVVDSNVLPYCSINRKEKKTIGEMEQEFLEALQAFYYDKKAIMSNEEFDNLKEELMWEGSSVALLRI